MISNPLKEDLISLNTIHLVLDIVGLYKVDNTPPIPHKDIALF